MFLAFLMIFLTVQHAANTFRPEKMIYSNSSYHDDGVAEEAQFGKDRLPVGPALFAVFGLSLLGWAAVLAPLVAILHH